MALTKEEVFESWDKEIRQFYSQIETVKTLKRFYHKLAFNKIYLARLKIENLDTTDLLFKINSFIDDRNLFVNWVAIEKEEFYKGGLEYNRQIGVEKLMHFDLQVVNPEDLPLYVSFRYKSPLFEKMLKDA